MRFRKTNLVAIMSCFMMLAAAPLLPARLSPMTAAYAKGGGGGGGNGGHGGEGVDTRVSGPAIRRMPMAKAWHWVSRLIMSAEPFVTMG
ncbi:hypothetical protein [Pseudomonas vanderleydeniana]|uniref:hypothetical protein n=1 Tax=Pseudomonas vanderleydeniana TaxID=2745495 RepID=UPI003461A6D9